MRAGINGWWLLCKLQSNIAVHYGILETIGETQQKQTTQMPREREREETNTFLSAIFRLSPIITSIILKSSTDQRMLSLKFTPAQMNGNETGCYANDFQETSKWGMQQRNFFFQFLFCSLYRQTRFALVIYIQTVCVIIQCQSCIKYTPLFGCSIL